MTSGICGSECQPSLRDLRSTAIGFPTLKRWAIVVSPFGSRKEGQPPLWKEVVRKHIRISACTAQSVQQADSLSAVAATRAGCPGSSPTSGSDIYLSRRDLPTIAQRFNVGDPRSALNKSRRDG